MKNFTLVNYWNQNKTLWLLEFFAAVKAGIGHVEKSWGPSRRATVHLGTSVPVSTLRRVGDFTNKILNNLKLFNFCFPKKTIQYLNSTIDRK